MSEDTMLVRMPGGDVVRRPVEYETRHPDYAGPPVREPELRDDEITVHLLGDPIPRIVKIR